MFSPAKKLVLSPVLSLMLVVGSLSAGFFQPAFCESAPRVRFYAYIKALYYATSVKQVSKFWIKNSRVPMDECLGTAAATKLADLKNGYIYNPRIITEILDGNICTMKGTGMGQSGGQRLKANIDVVMRFEEGQWLIQAYTWQGEIAGHY